MAITNQSKFVCFGMHLNFVQLTIITKLVKIRDFVVFVFMVTFNTAHFVD